MTKYNQSKGFAIIEAIMIIIITIILVILIFFYFFDVNLRKQTDLGLNTAKDVATKVETYYAKRQTGSGYPSLIQLTQNPSEVKEAALKKEIQISNFPITKESSKDGKVITYQVAEDYSGGCVGYWNFKENKINYIKLGQGKKGTC